MEKIFRRVMERQPREGAEWDVELLGVRPGNGPLDKSALERFTQASADVIRTFTGREPVYTPNSTDSNIPLSLGIPANTIGTVDGAFAHTRQEWVDLSSLATGLKIVLAIMLGYAA